MFPERLAVEPGQHEQRPASKPTGGHLREQGAGRPVHRPDGGVVAIRQFPVASAGGDGRGGLGPAAEPRAGRGHRVGPDGVQILLRRRVRPGGRGEVQPEEQRDILGGVCERPDPELPHPISGGAGVAPVLPELVETAPEAEFGGKGGMTDRGEGPVAVLAQPGREGGPLDQPGRLSPGAPARVHPGEDRRRGPPGLGPGGQRCEEHRPRRPEQVEVRTDVSRIAVDPEVVGAQRGDGDQDQAGPFGGDPRPRIAARGQGEGGQRRRRQQAVRLPGAHRAAAPARISMRRAPSASRSRRTRVASARR